MTKSNQLFQKSLRYIPGGVNSPVRAFRSVDSEPIFIQKGQGPYLTDVDGNAYIDYVCSWGPLILGHAHPYVIEKVEKALHNGFTFGASTEIECQLAQKVCESIPSIESVRFVNSGTEAAMSAIRLARGFTQRNKILKFSGCYHGHSDHLLVAAGSGPLTLGIPSSAGVPPHTASDTLVANYNQLEEVSALFSTYGQDIAAVIVEPIAGNMNLILPKPGFLSGLRKLCDQYNSLLIFDEVITGFRIGLGGAQSFYEVKPDITLLGKIIGGGFPAAAFGGRADMMQYLAPLGPVYQAGTLSGNPIAMTAGLATLELISKPNFYSELEKKTQSLVEGLNHSAEKAGYPLHVKTIASMFGIFFNNDTDHQQFKRFFLCMLKAGIYLAPSPFEIGFVSAAHGEKEITKTLSIAEEIFTTSQAA